MRALAITLLMAAAWQIGTASVDAKTTRTFSGSNPGELEKNARQAGYDYPVGEMQCSSRCTQRWAKD